LVVSLALVYACGQEATAPIVGPPAQVRIVSGDDQSAPAGTELPGPLVAKVADSSGLAVAGQLVVFVVTAGGGSVFAGVSITNREGIVQERWTLGTSTADSQRVEVRAVDNVTGAPLVFAVFRATALAGPAARLYKIGDMQTAQVGTAVAEPPGLTVYDQFSNPVPGLNVRFQITRGGGALVGESTATDPNGTARVGMWTLGTIAGLNTLLAQVGADSVELSGTGVAGPPATIAAFAGDSQVAQTGAAVAVRPAVKVTDSYGNAVSGVAVTFAAAASTVAGGLQTTDTGGIATVGGWTMGVDSGTYELAATAQGLNGSPVLFTALALPLPAFRATAVSAGFYHTCALNQNGEPFCWGYGGAVGMDSTVASAVPGGAAMTALASGAFHACGLNASGSAFCWGVNSWGEVGDGTTAYRVSPVAVLGGLTFQGLHGASQFTCGLATGGAGWCWGANNRGQLGNGQVDSGPSPTPTAVVGGLTLTRVVAGGAHACGIAVDGAAYCWGMDYVTGAAQPVPVAVPGGLQFTTLAAGFGHTCGLTSGATAYCWGDNEYFALGDTSRATLYTNDPVPVIGGMTFASLAAGLDFTCGLSESGAAYCWGRNDQSQLGDGTAGLERAFPGLVAGNHTFTALTAGGRHACGLASDGTIYCWGSNGYGQLGTGDMFNRRQPTAVRRR
jgi:alpha-tubulin suppressor-like RCC1 family protein